MPAARVRPRSHNSSPVRIVGGVDTHKHVQVAAALSHIGRVLDVESFPATHAGYQQLLQWLRGHGDIAAVRVEGCGSWGAGLARHLAGQGVTVIEVNRPNRQNRRRRGKSDPVDAEAAGRAVLNGDATVIPKSGDGPVEALRQLRVARAGAIKARITSQRLTAIVTLDTGCRTLEPLRPQRQERSNGSVLLELGHSTTERRRRSTSGPEGCDMGSWSEGWRRTLLRRSTTWA